MVLIKLVMCAFGSYAEENIIDFSHKQEGVFLITGDTGSGKTTIFDAITFALYGKTSGDRREGNMMRSQYAKKDQPSYIEFTFRIKRDVYVIRRNPAYDIETHYKNGKVKMVHKDETVTLIENGQEYVTTRKSEVNKRILEIIKVDFDQFTQIAMIAQGEFMKLLTAETKKKKEIFSKLFHTGIYQDIAKELDQKCLGYYRDLKDQELLCRSQIEQVDSKDTHWEETKTLPLSRGDEILACLKQLIEEDKKAWNEQKQNLDQIQEKQRKNETVITEGEALLALYQTKENLLKEGLKFADEFDQIPYALQELKGKETEISPQYHKAIEALGVFEKLYKMETEVNKCSLELDKCKSKSEKVQEEIELLKETLQELSKSVLEAGDPEKEVIILIHELDRVVEEQRKTTLLKDLYIKWKSEKKSYEECILQTEKERTLKNHLVLALQEVEDNYYLAQAGILAEHLQEGMPCPVCGSMEHPCITSLCEDAPTKEQLENCKVNLRAQEERYQKQMLKEGSVKEKLSQLAEQFGQRYLEEYGESVQIEMMGEEFLEDKLFQLKSQLATKNNELYKKNLLARQLESWKTQIQSIQEQINEKNVFLDVERVEKEKLQLKLTEAKTMYEQLKISTMDSSKEEIEAICIELKNKLDHIQIQIGKINELTSKMQLICQQIDNRPCPDLDVFYQLRQDYTEEKNQCEPIVQALMLKVNNNCQRYDFLNEHLNNIRNLAEKYETYLTLHEAANGRVAGKVKIDLETYVQRQYLKKILHAANQRLYEMSMGQFVLKLKDLSQAGKAGNEGLDLYVHSLVTNSDRDVKTLSGGESFIAALSMALGLSDVVTRTVGSIHLHLMFIDEGFGSLDDASRTQAIKILNSLAGTKTLVGIISHVSELKEQIEEKLVVSKGERGSKVRWVKF